MYTQQLPEMRELDQLVEIAGPYPAKVKDVMDIAKQRNLGINTVAFMRQFPADQVFENKEDFAARCYELLVLIKQERESPTELLRSPQD